jgi:hypothetical protein
VGVNCSICGIAPEEVEVIKKRGEREIRPGATQLFHPSSEATQIAGYDVDLHREYYGFHLMAQSFGEPLCFLIDGDAGYPGGLDGDYSGDQHCLRYVSLPRVKAIAELLSSLSFAHFVERACAAFLPDHECTRSARPCKSCRPITTSWFRFTGVPPKTMWP